MLKSHRHTVLRFTFGLMDILDDVYPSHLLSPCFVTINMKSKKSALGRHWLLWFNGVLNLPRWLPNKININRFPALPGGFLFFFPSSTEIPRKVQGNRAFPLSDYSKAEGNAKEHNSIKLIVISSWYNKTREKVVASKKYGIGYFHFEKTGRVC